jgi:hypothetical protein
MRACGAHLFCVLWGGLAAPQHTENRARSVEGAEESGGAPEELHKTGIILPYMLLRDPINRYAMAARSRNYMV